mgnify:CR=1 FL=1
MNTDGYAQGHQQDQHGDVVTMPDAITLAAILLYLSLRAAYASWKGL